MTAVSSRAGARSSREPLLRVWEGAALMAAAAVMPFRGELYVMVAALFGMLLVVASRGLRGVPLVVPLPALLVVVWCGLSTGWTILPYSTVVSAAEIGVLTLIGVSVAAGRDLVQLVEVFSSTCAALLLVSWATAVALPGVGLTQGSYEAGTLEGVFVHRNLLGYFGILAAVTFGVRLFHARGSRPALSSVLWLALSLVTIYATQSRTSWVVLGGVAVLASALFLIGRSPAPRTTLATAAALVAVALVVLAGTQYAIVVSGLGRDVTLTGRTHIWAAVLEAIQQRPLTGYGWGAAWPVSSPLSQHLAAEVGFTFYHAHDGFLDSALQIGLVGLTLSVVFLLMTLVRAAVAFLRAPSAACLWPVLVMTAVTLTNLTETVASLSIGWVLAVAIGAQQLAARWPAQGDPLVSPVATLSSGGRRSRPTVSSKGTP